MIRSPSPDPPLPKSLPQLPTACRPLTGPVPEDCGSGLATAPCLRPCTSVPFMLHSPSPGGLVLWGLPPPWPAKRPASTTTLLQKALPDCEVGCGPPQGSCRPVHPSDSAFKASVFLSVLPLDSEPLRVRCALREGGREDRRAQVGHPSPSSSWGQSSSPAGRCLQLCGQQPPEEYGAHSRCSTKLSAA